MPLDVLNLSPTERLDALRKLDIFHRWESVGDKRLCRRCGKIITGWEIRILGARKGGEAAHLECPSEGCLAVPLDWIMIDPSQEKAPSSRFQIRRRRAPSENQGMSFSTKARHVRRCSAFCACPCKLSLESSDGDLSTNWNGRLGARQHNLGMEGADLRLAR